MCLGFVAWRQQLYQQDKCGVAWTLQQEKTSSFAKRNGYSTDKNDPDALKASPGWMHDVLKRGDFVAVSWGIFGTQ